MEISESFLQEALESLKQDILSSFHVAMPGSIVSYDSSSGLGIVQPGLCQKTSAGTILTAPCLNGVPVFRPSEDYEVKIDSPCILLFMDFSMDGWLEFRQPVIPPSTRKHDLSDAIALVGHWGKTS